MQTERKRPRHAQWKYSLHYEIRREDRLHGAVQRVHGSNAHRLPQPHDRNRTIHRGDAYARPVAARYVLRHLHSVSKALRTALRKQVCEVLFIPDLLQYRMYLDPGIPPESIAVEVKDALKYGMLCWWYGGRDIPLFQLYRSLYETTVERLRDQIRSTHTERPYRIL